MKKGLIIIALLMFFRPVFPIFEYVLDYDHIANDLCINKDKPEMHCNGKCHLMKELAKASENEKPMSGKKEVKHDSEVLFCQAFADFEFKPAFFSTTRVQVTYLNFYISVKIVPLFRPPVIIS